MQFFDKFNTLFLKNRKLIFFILDEIKQCIPDNKWDTYYNQINCINKIQWVLNKEVDLYYDEKGCFSNIITDKKECKIATAVIYESKNKKYEINIYALNGKIFSLESNMPFRNLLVSNIQSIEIICKS